MYLEYSPNNSGGSFWHTDKQWQELIDLGWVDLGWRIIKQFPSFQDGMNEWQSIMQMNPEAEAVSVVVLPTGLMSTQMKKGRSL